MKWSLSGRWQNIQKEENDTVIIQHLRDDYIQIIGFGKNPTSFRNIGIGMIDGDCLIVEWTDLPESKGTEVGVAHRTMIKIISNAKLEQESDVILPAMTPCSRTPYGNWERQ